MPRGKANSKVNESNIFSESIDLSVEVCFNKLT